MNLNIWEKMIMTVKCHLEYNSLNIYSDLKLMSKIDEKSCLLVL